MAYRYYTSGSPPYIASSKNEMLNGFQSLIYSEFANSPTYFTIKEETVFASGNYTNVEVRITGAINSQTGEKLGDDFKNILFIDLDHATGLGYKYEFDDNIWVVVYSEIIKNIGASAMVRRCNNQLRWLDDNGNVLSEPVCLEYNISRPRDEVGAKDPVTPAGYLSAYCQLNDKTKLIKSNQRFLFGTTDNRVAFRVFGDGIRNFLNQKTLDDESANLLQLTMGGSYKNETTDNFTLGIADYYKNVDQTISSPISGSIVNAVRISPNTNYLLEGDTGTYSCYLYINNILQPDVFVFNSGSAVPGNHFILTAIDGNNFTIENVEKYLSDNLIINCTSGSYTRQMELLLKGAW